MKKFLCLSCMMFVMLTGCAKEQVEQNADSAVAKAKGEGVVLATVGDEVIRNTDLDVLLAKVPEQYRERYQSPEVQREILEKMVDVKMLAYEAKRRGLENQPDVQLKLEYLTDQLLAKELEDSAVDALEVSDKDLQAYYDEHKDRFSTPERVRARHILLKDKAKAEAVLARVKKGEDFAAVAQDVSEGPSAKKGGDLGWFARGRMDKDFEKAAFDLKEGEISGVVKSSFGYHIIKLEGRREAQVKDFDDVKGSIERIVRQEMRRTALDGLREKVRDEVKVEVNEEYFKKDAPVAEEGQAAATEQAAE